ncbi:MAG: hypothetical protein HYX94_02135 [Chloroflexi bacterium]|nr:hypothetical protein [Chloroflexota bacterium]
MSRITELQKKYPTLHKDVIVKWEMRVGGVQDSRDLDESSTWKPASHGSYRSYDEDFTLQRMKEETPWRVREDAILTPTPLWMKTGLGFPVWRKEASPYLIRHLGDGKFAIFEGDEMVDCELYREPPRERFPGLKTSKGTPVQDLVELNRRCYRIVPVRFCEYFTTGDECKFCNYNPTQEDARAVGVNRPVTIHPEETAEAFKIYGSQLRLIEGFLESGGFKKSEAESSINCKFVEAVSNALSYRTHMKLVAEALPRKELLRLRDCGLSAIRLQMEAFDERLFALINPGKAKHMSRDEWLECYENSVEIFGVGNVAAKFVGGVTMQGPWGYPTWQEARDSHAEGDRWMISHGVYPCMDCIRWAPGSPNSKDPSNRDKFPPAEFYLDLIVEHEKAMNEYGLFDKLNRFLYCGLDCHQGPYCSEQGIIERAGDFGAWMGERIPYEQNWIAQFLDSIKEKESAKSK